VVARYISAARHTCKGSRELRRWCELATAWHMHNEGLATHSQTLDTGQARKRGLQQDSNWIIHTQAHKRGLQQDSNWIIHTQAHKRGLQQDSNWIIHTQAHKHGLQQDSNWIMHPLWRRQTVRLDVHSVVKLLRCIEIRPVAVRRVEANAVPVPLTQRQRAVWHRESRNGVPAVRSTASE
jgi:hypothetical protein